MSIYAEIIAQSVPEWHESREVILYQSSLGKSLPADSGCDVAKTRQTGLKLSPLSDRLCKER
jgi:hypothetical protein